MSNAGKKLEPRLKLDMSFGEALERLSRVNPKEIENSMTLGRSSKKALARRKKDVRINQKDE
jgi:hypothetical protein